jgi:peptidoglycan hydrolase-like protein with peptidoglycan-binding domain
LKTGAWTVIDQAAKISDDAKRELQAQLRQAGVYKGEVDGRIGADTRAAMVEFARAG